MRRREFSKKVRVEIIARAMNADGQTVCEGCGLVLGKKPFEVDHTIAEALVIDKTKPLTAKDGQLLGKDCCHRGEDGKTNKDVADIAKAKRRQAKHIGAEIPKPKMQGPTFTPAAPQRKASRPLAKPSLPPIELYKDLNWSMDND